MAEIAARAHAAGALVAVDGVHLTAHAPVDVAALGADFVTCSPYKFLGPHCGVLAAAPALLETLAPDKLLPSTDAVPERFEQGTLPYELLAGTTAAVDFLAGLDPEATGSRRERVLGLDGRRRGVRGRPARRAGGRARRPSRGHPVVAGGAPHADAAAHLRRAATPPTPTGSWPSAA